MSNMPCRHLSWILLAAFWLLHLAMAQETNVTDNNCPDMLDEEKWYCQFDEADSGKWICVDLEPQATLDASLPLPLLAAFSCKEPLNVNYVNQEASLQVCDPACALYSQELADFCSSCELLESGQLAYGCRNLFPNSACAERDDSGTCGQDHVFWECIQDDSNFRTSLDKDFPYLCFTLDDYAQGLHPSMPHKMVPYFYCRDKTSGASIPSLSECDSYCLLFSEETQERCTSCTLLESGALAYDCSNLFPDIECPQRDANGNCQNHYHWECPNFQGEGYSCIATSGELDFLSLFSDNNLTLFTLYCANDITGQSTADCEQPVCTAFPFNIFDLENICAKSCHIADSGEIEVAEECLSQFITTPDAITNDTFLYPEIAQLLNNSTSLMWYASIDDGDDDDTLEFGWTLENIDPTVFNVVSDLVGYITRFVMGVTIAALYPFVMSWRLRREGQVRIHDMDIPGDFLGSLSRLTSWSLIPALLFMLLLFVADFSHSLADTGLNFVLTPRRGSLEPVLQIAKDRRNLMRPYQTAGDPLRPRTQPGVLLNGRTEAEVSALGDLESFEVMQERKQLLQAYMSSVSLIARGGALSPFVTKSNSTARSIGFVGNVSGFLVEFVANGDPVYSMESQIPLVCSSNELVEIEQRLTPTVPQFETELDILSAIPNCTFDGPRQSGIYTELPDAVHIVEMASRFLYPGPGPTIGFIENRTEVVSSYFSPQRNDKLLARDRKTWRAGRTVNGITGLQLGNTTVNFGTVVIATGESTSRESPSITLIGARPSIQVSTTEEKYYGLVAEISGECPPRPSGRMANETDCLAVVYLLCDPFSEESDSFYHPLYTSSDDSECRITSVVFAWGHNILPDETLIPVIGGMFGLVQPLPDETARDVIANCILSALFALGTVEEVPSVENVVRARINHRYIAFMVLPLAIFLFLVLMARHFNSRRPLIPIPRDAADLMTLTAEADDPGLVPQRPNRRGPFQADSKDLGLVFFDAMQPNNNDGPDIALVSLKSPTTAPPSQSVVRNNAQTTQPDMEAPDPVARFKPEAEWQDSDSSVDLS